MVKSTHKVEVIRLTSVSQHPNADRLDVIKVFDYTCCAPKGQFNVGDLAAYIPPDSIVDTSRPEFAFLAGHERIKVKKLRGVVSMGLLVPVPEGSNVGDDVADHYGVTHYNPPEPLIAGGEMAPAPPGYHPCYDVDSLRRYAHLFIEDEPVWITEKIHGASARFCWTEGYMNAGSRSTWKKYDPNNLWWKALDRFPEIGWFCDKHPDITVYGEVYGQVQNLKYGTASGEVRVAVFDLLKGSEWVHPQEALDLAPLLPWVPRLATTLPFSLETVLALAEGHSLVPGANHIREGIVVKPLVERTSLEVGRVCMKVVSNAYLEKA